MPPRENSSDTMLIAAYQEAALRIQSTLQQTTAANRGRSLAQINSFLRTLDQQTAQWVSKRIPAHFTSGSDEAVRQLRRSLPDGESLLSIEMGSKLGANGRAVASALADRLGGVISDVGPSGPLITFPDGRTLKIGFLDIDENGIFLNDIHATPTGGGLGTRTMNTLKDIAEEAGTRLHVSQVNNPEFFRKFDWLKETGDGDGFDFKPKMSEKKFKSFVESNTPGELDETFAVIHKEAVQVLVDDASQRFGSALEAVRGSSKGVISEVVKRKIMSEAAVNALTGAANDTAVAKAILARDGITALRTRAGQRLTLENYAATLMRTVISEAHNTGAGLRYMANGVKYGRVIERATAPDRPCQFFRGKYVNLAERRLYAPFHPNCMGGIAPVLKLPAGVVPFDSINDSRIPGDVAAAIAKRV